MVQTARNLIQVILLVALGVGLLTASGLNFVPRLPLCELVAMPHWAPHWVVDMALQWDSDDGPLCKFGDLAIWVTALAALLFTGRRRVAWALAPAACLVALHASVEFSSGLPEVGLPDGNYVVSRTDWAEVGGTVAQYVAFLLVALVTYACVSWSGRLMHRLAARRPSTFAAAARAARVSVIGLVAAVLSGWLLFSLWSFTASYQVYKIHRAAVIGLNNSRDVWVRVALEADVPQGVVDRAKSRLDTDASAPTPPCDPEAILHGVPPLALAEVTKAVRGCIALGKPEAAITIWHETLYTIRGNHDWGWQAFLEAIPPKEPRPTLSAVFRAAGFDATDRDRDRGALAAALFRALSRSGRGGDAISCLEELPKGVALSADDALGQPADPTRVRLTVPELRRLATVIRDRYAGADADRELGTWLHEISRELALAGDPETALGVLNIDESADRDTTGAIVDAFQRQGLFTRALEVLKVDDPDGGSYEDVRGRLCVAMVKARQTEACWPMLDQLILRDHTKVLALAGLSLMHDGEHARGLTMLDHAQDLAVHGYRELSSYGNLVDPELVGIFADAGRVRAAVLIADRMADEGRASGYLLVLRRIIGWRRTLGIAVGRLVDGLPLS